MGIDLFPKYYPVLELQLVSQNWNFFTKELFSEKKIHFGKSIAVQKSDKIFEKTQYLDEIKDISEIQTDFRSAESTERLRLAGPKWHFI